MKENAKPVTQEKGGTMDFRTKIRTIPDYPEKGIMFRDVSTLMADAEAFGEAIERMSAPFEKFDIHKVAGIDARGFILGGAMATRLKAGFLPLRKPGKLPYKTWSETYELEYGSATLAIHVDAIKKDERVVILDDLLATEGTARATGSLVGRLGGTIVSYAFLIELEELNGTELVQQVYSIIKF